MQPAQQFVGDEAGSVGPGQGGRRVQGGCGGAVVPWRRPAWLIL